MAQVLTGRPGGNATKHERTRMALGQMLSLALLYLVSLLLLRAHLPPPCKQRTVRAEPVARLLHEPPLQNLVLVVYAKRVEEEVVGDVEGVDEAGVAVHPEELASPGTCELEYNYK